MNKDERIAQNARILRTLGYAPEVTEAGGIRFKIEGVTCFLMLDDEVAYWSLLYHRFWPIREGQRARVEEAAIAATAGTKVAKVYLAGDDNVTASVELLLPSPEAPPIRRAVATLLYAVSLFKEKMAQ